MVKVLLAVLMIFSFSFGKELKHIKDILNFTDDIVFLLPKEETLKKVKSSALKHKTVVLFKTFLTDLKNKKIIGYRKFHEKEIYDLLFKVSYIIKLEKEVVFVVFYFYKPDETWYLYDFSYKTDVKSFF